MWLRKAKPLPSWTPLIGGWATPPPGGLGGRRAHVEGGRLRQVVHPVEDALVLLRRDHVLGGAAAGGHQEEEVEHHGAVAGGEVGDGLRLVQVVAGGRGGGSGG